MTKRLVLVTNRRLDDVRSGSGAYLRMALDAAKSAGFEIKLILAPDTAFGSRPWMKLAPEIVARAAHVALNTANLGGTLITLEPRAWARFFNRLVIAALQRMGVKQDVRSLLSDVPSASELDALARAVRAEKPDVALVEYSSLGPLLEKLSDVPARAVLMHDLFSSRAASFRAAGKAIDHADITLEEEAARVRAATLILHASMNELARLQPLAANARHVWMRPVARLRRDSLRQRPPAAAFIGADHAGNREALDHLLGEIWPKVRARAPEAKLLIAGSICQHVWAPQPGVELKGPLSDLSALAGPDIVGLAPIRVSSGIAIKVADYLGLGMPVVGYPGGLDGFGDVLDGVVARVEDSDAFATVVADLLTNKAARHAFSEAGLKLAESALSKTGIEEALG